MADFEELIGVQLDPETWRSSLTQIEREYDDFLTRLNAKDFKVSGSFSGDFGGIANQVSSLSQQIGSLKDAFNEVFGAGEEAATEAAGTIKARVEEAATAAVASERAQTEAVVAQSARRTEARTKEAKEWQALQKELKSADSTRDARRFDQAALSARQSLERELQALQKEVEYRKSGSGPSASNPRIIPVEEGSEPGRFQNGLAAEMEQAVEAHQRLLKTDDGQFQREMDANASAVKVLERELEKAAELKQKAQGSLRNAPVELSEQERFDSASSGARASLASELEKRERQQQAQAAKDQQRQQDIQLRQARQEQQSAARAAQRAAEQEQELQSRTGVGGFVRGLGEGLTPGKGNAGDLGEFIGDVVRFQVAWSAVGAVINAVGEAIKAPIEFVKNGIEYLAKMQETASEIRAGLLEAVKFSDDPAKNLDLASKAADVLTGKIQDLAATLNTSQEKIQTSFMTFSEFGGNSLTRNLGESLNVAGVATAALQAQNPNLPQRQVASELQKLVSGTLAPSSKLAAALGISSDKLNEMALHARTYHDLNDEIVAQTGGLVERLQQGDGRFDSLVSKANLLKERLEGAFSAGIFEVLEDMLRRLIGYFDENKVAIMNAAGAFSDLAKAVATSFEAMNSSSLSPLITGLRAVGDVVATLTASFGNVAAKITEISNRRDIEKQYNAKLSQNGEDFEAGRITADERDRRDKAADDAEQQQTTANEGNYKTSIDQIDKQFDSTRQAIWHPSDYAKEHPAKKDDDALNFQGTKHGPPGDKKPAATSVVAELKEGYDAAVKEIQEGVDGFREHVQELAKKGTLSLSTSTALLKVAFSSEASQIEAAGKDYRTRVEKAVGSDKKAATAKQRFLDHITEVDRTSENKSTKGVDALDDQGRTRERAVQQAQDKGQQNLDLDKLTSDYGRKQLAHQRGYVSDEQAAKDQHDFESDKRDIERQDLQKQIADANDPLHPEHRVELQQRLSLVDQQDAESGRQWQDQQKRLPFEEHQAQLGMQVEAQRANTDDLKKVVSVDQIEGADPGKIKQDENAALRSEIQANNIQLQQLGEALKELTEGIITQAKASGTDPVKALASNHALQQTQLKIQQIKTDSIHADALITKNNSATLAKYDTSAATNRLLGSGGDDGGHWHSLEEAGDSLQNVAGNISGGVSNVINAYQQQGAGGAVGAGLSAVGQFIPGPAGSIISAVGSLTSMFSGLFTAAAQNIGKEVAKAVDTVMEKYSTGQLSLNDTIAAVQQQINSLVAQESGQKGGQSVLDKELPGLQQELDSLKYQQQQEKWNFQDATVESSSTNSVTDQWLTDWININKQVYQYQQAVGSAGDAQIAQYLNQQMQQQQVQLQTQYNQGQQQALNDALQLNTLLQQRNNYEDQYRQQQFQILSADSLQRRGNPAEESARKLSMAKSQYDQQTQQMNYEIAQYQQKVDYEKQIFNLASDTATLQQQSLAAQNFQLQQQMAQYQAIVQLLAETAGATYANGSWNIPGITTSSGGGFTIPGTNNSTSTDNSVNGQTVSITLQVPPGMSASDLANEIASEIAYVNRTRT